MSKRNIAIAGGAIVALLLAIIAYNALIWFPVSGALKGETDVDMVAYRRSVFSPSSIVIDIRGIQPSASMAAVDRSLFKVAEALKDRRFETVVLAYKGKERFLLDADHFQELGEERSYQNPIYMIRMLPEHVKNLDGSPAFGTWTGGWLGVAGKQIEDHNHFHAQWYMEEAVGSPSVEAPALVNL